MEDQFQIDQDNKEFLLAVDTFKNSRKSFFLTGKAGAGKTTFLKYVKTISNKNIVVLAPTGIAAINAGGSTINSFFQIPFDPLRPDDHRFRTRKEQEDHITIYEWLGYRESKREIIRKMDVLIIDEISMVRADTLDAIDRILGVFRNRHYQPFGGVQVVMIGDPFQLPPICNDHDWSIISKFYDSPYFFNSRIFEIDKPLTIELQKVYRQAGDQRFVKILNEVRFNEVSKESVELLNDRCIKEINKSEETTFIHLCVTNKTVDFINQEKLVRLDGDAIQYEGRLEGKFPENYMRTTLNMELKVGAQVMIVVNDSGTTTTSDLIIERKYFNGSLGTIKECNEDHIVVLIQDEEIVISRYTWQNIKYEWNPESRTIDKEVIGEFTQIPVRLAWAITIHKSQGLTFDHVIADINSAFAPGQVYTALSRCTSLDGLILVNQLNKFAIKVDRKVSSFAKGFLVLEDLNEEVLDARADHLYEKARYAFLEKEFSKSRLFLEEAMKIRDEKSSEEYKRIVSILLKIIKHWGATNRLKHDQREDLTDLLKVLL